MAKIVDARVAPLARDACQPGQRQHAPEGTARGAIPQPPAPVAEGDGLGRIIDTGPPHGMRFKRGLGRRVQRQEPAAPALGFTDQEAVGGDVRNVDPERLRYPHAGRGQKAERRPGSCPGTRHRRLAGRSAAATSAAISSCAYI